MVLHLLEMMKLVHNSYHVKAPGTLGNARRMSKGLLAAFWEAGTKSGVLKASKSFNFGSLLEVSLTLWRDPESFMELSSVEKNHF